MFTQEELKNIVILIKAGVRSLDLNGKQIVAVGALVDKCEGLVKEETREKKDTLKK